MAVSKSNHVFHDIHLHVNWHCQADLPLVTDKVEDFLGEFIPAYIKQHEDLWFHGFGCTADHIHVAFQISPSLCPAEVIGQIKGASSSEINKQFRDDRFKWQRGYGVVSFARRNIPGVLTYINSQKEHHSQGTVRKMLEFCDENAPESLEEWLELARKAR